ncbi:CheW domain-containing protein [Nodosilinea sp. FACHB-13]|uniref:chemotaxis protein CheW n=1 Tax=Cyanophyceae TaxID=3028117 RepID=UPI00168405FE|nr:CheW domain-containing protein [Nodosilinea sp. FACHB-13]MBD2108871.1 chemotaxis protein CheW [Nodosilinea sp. FACHB-13]
MNSETATPTDNLIPPLQDATSPGAPEEQFLKVVVNGGLPLLLPGANLVEIMKLSIGQVVPMFQMAPWVMGLYNWRGEMLWVADLGHFLGFAPWYNQAEAATRHTVVVIKPPYRASQLTDEQTATLGLVVNAVEAMVAYPVPALQPLSAAFSGQSIPVEPGLLPFLRGCCVDSADRPQLILDGTAVLNAMAQA